ncbi:hypothetical protein ABT120_47190 [Nonomuraea angiospora]|jgi:hypothetical protein|uniref:hypothetical protein n=1 Tax=Nonomuraea angiospora TaxID=46172 RepID=UPI0033168A33
MSTMSGCLSMVMVAALPLSARADSVGHSRCSPRTIFKADWLSPRNFTVPRTRYIDGPGGKMRVSVTREHQVRASIETFDIRPAAISIGDLVRGLQRMGLPHLREEYKVFAGHEYKREVSKGMYGNIWYRVAGYRIGWSAWSVLGTCRHVQIDSGIANVPARVEGWRYWETRHPQFKGRRLDL